jgi:hypothetical protein
VILKSDPRARLRPCLRCGYSLRNVPDARVCPECGLPVWLTLGGNDDLEMSNPQWLRRLALAMLVLAAAHALLFLGVLGMHALHAFVEDPWLVMYEDGHAVDYVGAAYFAGCGVGLILLGGEEGRIPERARGLRRTAIVAGAIALGLAAWAAAPVYDFPIPIFLMLLIATGQAVAGWAYVQQLARRIPSRRIETFANYLWIAVLLAFASVFLRGFGWVTWMLYSPWSRYVVAWTVFLTIYPPLAMAMFIALARRFHLASKAAAKNWEAE